MFSALIVFLSVSLVLAASGIIVPSIDTTNDNANYGFILEQNGDEYTLRINQTMGIRQETVREIAPGELLVIGKLAQEFKDYGYIEISYEAGRNGNMAKYKFTKGKKVTRLPPVALKNLAG